MSRNVGSIDRVLRIVIGAALLWFAFTSASSYAWIGYVGIVPLLTALMEAVPSTPFSECGPAL